MKECKVTCLTPPVHLPDLNMTLEQKGQIVWLSETQANSSSVLWFQSRTGNVEARWVERCKEMKRDETKTHRPPWLKNLRPSIPATPEAPKPNVDVEEIARVAREEAAAGMREELNKFKNEMTTTITEALKQNSGLQDTTPLKAEDIAAVVKATLSEATSTMIGVAPEKKEAPKDEHPAFIPDNLVKKGSKKVDIKSTTTADSALDAASKALKAAKADGIKKARKKPGPKPK